jgi:hypothetical protein
MAAFDLLSETKACDLLARLFRASGFTIVRNIPFQEYGVSFHIDGWDAKARVGFEFLTSEDEDHDDLTLREYQTLMAAQQRGELSLFILDEVEPLSAVDLTAMANDFLDEVAEAAAARKAGRRPAAAKPAGKKSAAKKPAGIKPTGKKPLAKHATGKPAARKPATKAAAVRIAAKKPTKPVKQAVAQRAKKPAGKPAAKQVRTGRSR